MTNRARTEAGTWGATPMSGRSVKSAQCITGWLAIVAGCLMVAGSLLPWISGFADITGYVSQNLSQLSYTDTSTVDGFFGIGLGAATILFGLARLAPSFIPNQFARSPGWSALGCAMLLSVDVPRAIQVVTIVNRAPRGGNYAQLGVGIVVFGAGLVLATASARLSQLASSPASPSPGTS
ncbi:MAG: hypothetical protein M0027_06345 [Candidatus Dormibacteraeota bacterium]|nr:hypothetical protein [Candidatus Dormibacteraeota bacterium]